MNKLFGYILPVSFLIVTLLIAGFTRPSYSFAGDSIAKVLQSVFWIESGFKKQGIHYPAKAIDPEYKYFYFKHSYNLQIDQEGSLIAPFPFLNTVLITPFIQLNWPEGIVYLGAVLFWLYSFLIYRVTKKWWVFLFILLFTPLLQHFLAFSDIALASFFLTFFLVTYFKEPRFHFITATAVLFAILALFLRTEILLLFVLLVMIHLFSIFNNGIGVYRKKWHSKRILLIVLAIFVFVGLNYFLYDSILGPRFDNNKTGIFRFGMVVIQKWKSLLLWGNSRVGLFGYSPWLLVFIVIFMFFHSQKRKTITRNLFYVWILIVCLVSILSPNDSNIDWGTRYYSCFSLFPILLLSNFKWKRLVGRNKYILILFLGVGLLYSVYINSKVWKEMKNISVQIEELVMKLNLDAPDYYIVEDPSIANSLGIMHVRTHVFYGNPIEVVENLGAALKGKRVRFLLFPLAKLAVETEPFWGKITANQSCVFSPVKLRKTAMFSALCKID
ncbi:LA_3751/LA_3752 family putative glycosyltransferase [Leptospira vanthielii]|uniref:Glycosyltransferase RgtA/B/C/D-like domain-containing protein n=1 Tax=Leptospira vanthielii TaxID=293085 RepID=A0ABY2NKU8_9LEPT|nr:hypothetical protein [Leptospira vanthielii]TGM51356.1 hypothetical protein EHQ95_13655 [Leptospira vanthielii]